MHRELNPQLFGTPTSHVEPPRNQVNSAQQAKGSNPAVGYGPNEIKALEHQMSMLRVALNQMEKRSDQLNAKIDELGRGVHARLERFSQAIIRVEELQSQQNQENTGRHAQLSAKVNERKATDAKIQEMIDRHNTIVRNFENRLTSLQRLTTEQELTLHNAHAALEEARAELSKRR
jgi:hypothetical protein